MALGGLVSPRALASDRVHNVGVMVNTGPEPAAGLRKAIEEMLAARGFVAGRNLKIHYVYTGRPGGDMSSGSADLIEAGARELVAMKPDVIYVDSSNRAKALQAQTKVIPIVFSVGGDPVASGLVSNLAQPGGNITGSSRFIGELVHKRIELTRELLPRARRAALVADFPYMVPLLPGFPEVFEATAKGLGLELTRCNTALRSNDLDAALRSLLPPGVEALLPIAPYLGPPQSPFRILEDFEKRSRIPVIHDLPGNGAIALGADWMDSLRAAMEIVAQILNGARPAVIPINRATRIILTVNRSRARAIGLSIPQSILVRADHIED